MLFPACVHASVMQGKLQIVSFKPHFDWEMVLKQQFLVDHQAQPPLGSEQLEMLLREGRGWQMN